MRLVTVAAMLATTTLLSGCAGGDEALSLAVQGGVCGVNDPDCAVKTPTTGTTTPTVNTGNTTVIAAKAFNGDLTIALEKTKLKLPTTGNSLSILTIAGATAKFQIDTKTGSNGDWPTAKLMAEYVYGTCFNDGGMDPNNHAQCVGGVKGTGLGGYYNEYRNKVDATTTDEILQVWNWKNSHAVQYRDETNGTFDLRNQAWSFGGNKTVASEMTTLKTANATAHFDGKYGGTSKTWNWIDPNLSANPVGGYNANRPGYSLQTLSRNGFWRVLGTSSIDANFGTGVFKGTLTPQLWVGVQSMNSYSGIQYVLSGDTADLNHASFMNDQIDLNGTININATSVAGDNGSGAQNFVSGTAELDPTQSWMNSDKRVYAAFFGTNATEVTGIYNFEADSPSPMGGDLPIGNTTHGYVQQGGVFNACKVQPCN